MAEDVGLRSLHRVGFRKRKEKTSSFKLVTPLWLTLFYAGAAFLLGRAAIFNDLHPFGMAFFTAVQATRPELGLIVGLATAGGMATISLGPQLLTSLVGIVLVWLALDRLARGHKSVPLLAIAGLAAVSAAAPKGVYLALVQGNLQQSLALGCEALLAAALSVAFTYVLSNRARLEVGAPLGEETACWLMFLLGLLGGLQGFKIGSLSLIEVGADFLVLLAALTGGAGGGAVAGVAVGLIPTMTVLQPPAWIALYSVSGLLGGLMASFRRPGVVMGFLLGVLMLSVYFFDRSAVESNVLAALIASGVFFLVPNRLMRFAGWLPLAGERSEEYWRQRLQRAEERISDQLRQLASVFNELGASFSHARQRNARETAVSCSWNELVPKICASCPVNEQCWQSEGQATLRSLSSLMPLLQEKGRLQVGDLPRVVRNSCIRPRELVAGANRMWEDYHRFVTWQDQLDQTRELVSDQLTQVSGLMREMEKGICLREEFNQTQAMNIANGLRLEGIRVEDVEAVNQRDGRLEVRIRMRRCEDKAFCRKYLADFVSGIVKQQLAVDDSRCPWQNGGRDCQIRLLPSGVLRVQTGLAQAARDGCAFSGDAWAALPINGGYYLLALSDGMGSGHKAAQDSETAISLIKRLTNSGFHPVTAVRTVNSLLVQCGNKDNLTTIDLITINLYTGEGQLVKVGAAPSFLKRGDNVWLINGGTPPAGVLSGLEVNVNSAWLEPGDLLLLVTDGMMVRGEEWLKQALAELKSVDPQAAADLLLHQAMALAGNQVRDDMSVMVARVEKA